MDLSEEHGGAGEAGGTATPKRHIPRKFTQAGPPPREASGLGGWRLAPALERGQPCEMGEPVKNPIVAFGDLTADPCGENPFPPKDPRHLLWKDCTREAEKDIAKLCAGLLKDACTSFGELAKSRMIETITVFDIWTWRTLASIRVDKDIDYYDQWLLDYANSLIDIASAPQWMGPLEIAEIQRQLAQRIQVRKVEARERASQLMASAAQGIPSGGESLVPTPAATNETQEDRARRRQHILGPALQEKGWTVYRWEKEAGVASKVGQRYYDGDTERLNVDSEKKLSDALGIPLPL